MALGVQHHVVELQIPAGTKRGASFICLCLCFMSGLFVFFASSLSSLLAALSVTQWCRGAKHMQNGCELKRDRVTSASVGPLSLSSLVFLASGGSSFVLVSFLKSFLFFDPVRYLLILLSFACFSHRSLCLRPCLNACITSFFHSPYLELLFLPLHRLKIVSCVLLQRLSTPSNMKTTVHLFFLNLLL